MNTFISESHVKQLIKKGADINKCSSNGNALTIILQKYVETLNILDAINNRHSLAKFLYEQNNEHKERG